MVFEKTKRLLNDFVLSMVQDDNGFIWFGTHVGIVRFDGHSFNLFQPDPQKSRRIKLSFVVDIFKS